MNILNHSISKHPVTAVFTTKWLNKQGVYKQLIDNYKKSGWIQRVGQGAYKLSNQEITWESGIYALQNQLELKIHPGGKTALYMHGISHYISKYDFSRIVLWKTPQEKLPIWFKKYSWSPEIEIRSVNLFENDSISLSQRASNNIELQISSPERAFLEYLYDIPENESLDEAHYLTEGISGFRPAVVQKLLESCTSIRVKRLFLYLSEFYNHSWFKYIDESKIELGSGKREIVKGGILNKKYQIIIPEIIRVD